MRLMKCYYNEIITICSFEPFLSEGVSELDCFGKHLSLSRISWKCVWTPVKHQTQRYTLCIEQTEDKRDLKKNLINELLNLIQFDILHRKTHSKMHANISETSQNIHLSKKFNMTAHVFDKSDLKSCTKTVFRGSPQQLGTFILITSSMHPILKIAVRCGPPSNVHLNRHSRQLDIQASWRKEETKYISLYSVRYKELNSSQWKEVGFKMQSKDRNRCTVGNLNSSLSYEVQIECVANNKCTQCPWSEVFTVPPELTDTPVIEMVKDSRPQTKGRRLVIIKWKVIHFPVKCLILPLSCTCKFAASELAEGYSVSVGKASGEDPIETFNTSRHLLIVTLSHSAYHLKITALNRAGTSPAAQSTIRPLDDKDLYGKLNVTFNGNTSFTVSWVDDLIKTYSCFSVEWWTRGNKAAHKSFYEDENNYEVIPLHEPLELYKRYTFTLHTRPDKEPCNLKFINNSESTYGSIQSYFTEGSPISAPGNISSSNVTQSSMVLEWTSVPEKDTRGFLLGYILHYTESPDDRTDAETNVTVDAGSTSYELVDLKSNTVYQVQLSAFTAAGMGVRSSTVYFETKSTVSLSIGGMIAGVVIGATLLLLVVNLGSRLLKRAKRLLWPSIPNPGNSNAIQKIDGVCELELLEPINRQKLEEEEGDTNSLHIVDSREETSPVSNLHSNTDSCLHLNTDHEENQGPSKTTADSAEPTEVDPQINMGLCRRNTATDSSAQDPTSDTIKPTTDTRPTDLVPISTVPHQCPQLSFMSDYTTMELFQQAMTQCVPATISLEPHGQSSQSEDTDSPPTRPELDYIHQSLYDTVLHLSQGSTSPSELYYTVL
ncbi:interleukin-31 receptor subunit alpha [Salvelinus fontinalis]|uniref:interleukin-31 receptor subunit alpha n=1 Tax=Salvelinus fontinalis TaxID=8038 RepID=UPI002486C605|nr:interleukin-31 receptor subunit alpha [Salvelinus fontinalis]